MIVNIFKTKNVFLILLSNKYEYNNLQLFNMIATSQD